MTEKEEKAIKIVRKFNIENRFRDCGVLNNSIETVLKALEQKDKIIKYWKNGFERELESNKENIIEIIKKDKEISELKEEINYWKEYAEGEAGLRKQIQEDYQEQMQELLESEK